MRPGARCSRPTIRQQRDRLECEGDDDGGFRWLYTTEGLDLEQAQRRHFREHQPAHRRGDAREGFAGGASPPATLVAGHAERRKGDDPAGGTAGAGPQRRRI